jgi:hypothetical protein
MERDFYLFSVGGSNRAAIAMTTATASRSMRFGAGDHLRDENLRLTVKNPTLSQKAREGWGTHQVCSRRNYLLFESTKLTVLT